MNLKTLNNELLNAYINAIPKDLQQSFDALQDAPISTPNFSFYTSVASVFSSKIEGEDIVLDSYIKHKRDGIPFQIDYTKKTDDLYNAYLFAQQNAIDENAVKAVHKLLSKHIVAAPWQGKYRSQNMYVATDDGQIEYVAASPYMVPSAMQLFFDDVTILLNTEMDFETTFFYAALLHLVFVKIHPWNDGNGRTARLLEKWFLAQKLGSKAWYVQSEKMYYIQHNTYYDNIRRIDIEYDYLDYSKALPFLRRACSTTQRLNMYL